MYKMGKEPRKKLSPFVSSSNLAIETMLNISNAGPNDVLYDAGSGDGKLLTLALQEPYNVKRAVGIEIDPYYVKKSIENLNNLQGKIPSINNFEVKHNDFLLTDFKDATLVAAYLFSDILELLGQKFKNELTEGARVVTNVFPIPNWNLSKKVKIKNEYDDFLELFSLERKETEIFLYEMSDR